MKRPSSAASPKPYTLNPKPYSLNPPSTTSCITSVSINQTGPLKSPGTALITKTFFLHHEDRSLLRNDNKEKASIMSRIRNNHISKNNEHDGKHEKNIGVIVTAVTTSILVKSFDLDCFATVVKL